MRHTSPPTEVAKPAMHNGTSPSKSTRGAKQTPVTISLPSPMMAHSAVDNDPASLRSRRGATYSVQNPISQSRPAGGRPQVSPIVESSIGTTYADQMHLPASKVTVDNPGRASSYSNIEHRVGTTYADIMARLNSNIRSGHAPPKPEGMISPKQSPPRSAVPESQKLEASQYAPCLWLLILDGPNLTGLIQKGKEFGEIRI
jgi:hypothetical protein